MLSAGLLSKDETVLSLFDYDAPKLKIKLLPRMWYSMAYLMLKQIRKKFKVAESRQCKETDSIHHVQIVFISY